MAKRSGDDFELDPPEDEREEDDDDSLSDEYDDGDDDDDNGDDDGDDGDDEEESVEPDHPDSVAALREIGARLEVGESGHVWRLFFYEKNTDQHLSNVHGLTALKEIWLIGSRVTPKAVEAFKEKYPKVKVYY